MVKSIRLMTPELLPYFSPFIQAGIFANVDVHVIDALHQRTPGSDLEALLACAFAVRAPRHGHICIDLDTISETSLMETGTSQAIEGQVELSWPTENWIRRVAESPLVYATGSTDPKVISAPFVLDETRLYMQRYWAYQSRLADALRLRACGPKTDLDMPELGRIISCLFPDDSSGTNRQALGVAIAALKPFAVISGGPGMGKTFTVRNLLTTLFVLHQNSRTDERLDDDGLRVALAAPTGKAAARLRSSITDGLHEHVERCAPLLSKGDLESLRRFLTQLQSFTVHRLLGFNPSNRSRFRFDAHNGLPYDVIIVDEASMVDFAMMAKLVDAVDHGSKLILLGDKHQLASVEAGSVMRDMCGPIDADALFLSPSFAEALTTVIDSSVTELTSNTNDEHLGDCIVQLNRNYRFKNESGIGAFAAACLRNDMTTALAVFEDDTHYTDIQRLEYDAQGRTTDEINRLMIDELSPFLRRLLAGPQPDEPDEAFHSAVLKAFDQARLLCTHRKGPLGVQGVNTHVEGLLQELLGPLGFSPQQRHYLGRPVMVTQNDYATGLFNGDIGIFVDCRVGASIMRRVVFPSDEGVRYIPPARLPAHDTAYAMTIHKSQGSQFAHAIVVLPRVMSRIVTRELIYTGVTRAGLKATLLGPINVLEEGLMHEVQRASGLRNLLWNR